MPKITLGSDYGQKPSGTAEKQMDDVRKGYEDGKEVLKILDAIRNGKGKYTVTPIKENGKDVGYIYSLSGKKVIGFSLMVISVAGYFA